MRTGTEVSFSSRRGRFASSQRELPVGSVETRISSNFIGSQASITATTGSGSPTCSGHVLEPGAAHALERSVEPPTCVLAACRHEQREVAGALLGTLAQRVEKLVGARGHVGYDQHAELPGHLCPLARGACHESSAGPGGSGRGRSVRAAVARQAVLALLNRAAALGAERDLIEPCDLALALDAGGVVLRQALRSACGCGCAAAARSEGSTRPSAGARPRPWARARSGLGVRTRTCGPRSYGAFAWTGISSVIASTWACSSTETASSSPRTQARL